MITSVKADDLVIISVPGFQAVVPIAHLFTLNFAHLGIGQIDFGQGFQLRRAARRGAEAVLSRAGYENPGCR